MPTPPSCRLTRHPRNARMKALQAAFESAFPIVSHNGFVEMKFVEYNLAKPAFDVRECQTRGLTFSSAVRAKRAADHLRPRVLHAAVQGGQGSEGAGGLHGRSAPDDRQGLVHHQRHRARDRVAAAPLARRVLRARQGQDPQLGQAAVLGAHHSLPRLLAGLRIRPQGHPVLPRRPPPQDAGHHPAQGHRPEPRADPGELLRQRQLPPDGQRRADGVRGRAPEGRGGALRHHRQVGQGHRRQGQAHHRAPHARAGAVGHHPHQRARGLPDRPRGGPQATSSIPTPARSSPRPTTS
jgi:hypothetical protein